MILPETPKKEHLFVLGILARNEFEFSIYLEKYDEKEDVDYWTSCRRDAKVFGTLEKANEMLKFLENRNKAKERKPNPDRKVISVIEI